MPASYTLQASEHPIKSVTVFKSSKAEVVRTFTLNLKVSNPPATLVVYVSIIVGEIIERAE